MSVSNQQVHVMQSYILLTEQGVVAQYLLQVV